MEQRKVTELVEVFAQQTGLQRKQVEKEVMQLLTTTYAMVD